MFGLILLLICNYWQVFTIHACNKIRNSLSNMGRLRQTRNVEVMCNWWKISWSLLQNANMYVANLMMNCVKQW